MDSTYRHITNTCFSLLIILFTYFICERFILALAWAAVIATIAWPSFERILRYSRNNATIASAILTGLLMITIALPFLYILKLVISETQSLTHLLVNANQNGISAPEWFSNVPFIGDNMTENWNRVLGTPQGLTAAISNEAHKDLNYLSDFARQLGFQLMHRTMSLGFTLMCVFFFFRDGTWLTKQLNAIGHNCMGARWHVYSHGIPNAIRATVNGIVLVGLGVGLIMGCIYALIGTPAPAIFGAVTAVFAMIPFAICLVFAVLCFILLAQAKMIATVILLISGIIVMFIADHIIRPVLIQGATQLPFLAVLFGILGGVETLGVIGLFVGPAIMVLFNTLWNELADGKKY